MFDDGFKCDFEDMEGLSLNGDAFHKSAQPRRHLILTGELANGPGK